MMPKYDGRCYMCWYTSCAHVANECPRGAKLYPGSRCNCTYDAGLVTTTNPRIHRAHIHRRFI